MTPFAVEQDLAIAASTPVPLGDLAQEMAAPYLLC